uniref:Grh/CP2 DB domain-containing protein n=1 Tax=Rhinolophus ferrumequinum TaxID=59479 RepID=A0A671F1Z1_RHIFE
QPWVLSQSESPEWSKPHRGWAGQGSKPQCPPLSGRESLPLPYLKQEELPNIPSEEPPCPALQYVLCAATSPAVKQQEEALTYLNQGQSYEVQMLCNSKLGDATQWPRLLKSVVRVVFHDRRLQYTEQQQLDGWRWSRPGDRILDIDVPLSVGVIEPQVLPSQLNTVEFHWDPTKRTSLFLQVHCISTEFTPRKKGGEKGVPFRLQIDTFKPSDKELPPEHLHSAGCLIKVFKPKGADRKLKTDREKIERQPLHERDKYQTACESTVFVEVCVCWGGGAMRGGLEKRFLPPGPPCCLFVQCSPWPEPSAGSYLPLSPLTVFPPTPDLSPWVHGVISTALLMPQDLNPGASILETQQWLHRHRFSSYCRMLANFTGTDLLKLTRQDLIQICGAADGIRLIHRLFSWPRPIRHRLTLYVAQEASRQENEVPKNPDSGEILASLQKPFRRSFYQEISLDELSALELMGKLAELLALPANQIHHLFHQGPGGILILLSDQVVQNLKDESHFVAVVKKGRGFTGRWQLRLCQRGRDSYS